MALGKITTSSSFVVLKRQANKVLQPTKCQLQPMVGIFITWETNRRLSIAGCIIKEGFNGRLTILDLTTSNTDQDQTNAPC